MNILCSTNALRAFLKPFSFPSSFSVTIIDTLCSIYALRDFLNLSLFPLLSLIFLLLLLLVVLQVRSPRRADLHLPRGLRQAARARRSRHADCCQRRQPQAAGGLAAQGRRAGGDLTRRRRDVGRGSTRGAGGVRGGRPQVFHGCGAPATR